MRPPRSSASSSRSPRWTPSSARSERTSSPSSSSSTKSTRSTRPRAAGSATAIRRHCRSQIGAVDSVLGEIGADELPVELVLNKIDAVDAATRRRHGNRYPAALQISALSGEGLPELRARVAELFGERFEPVRLLLPYEEGARLNELYALGAPIEEREDTPEGVLVLARLPRREVRRFARYLVSA